MAGPADGIPMAVETTSRSFCPSIGPHGLWPGRTSPAFGLVPPYPPERTARTNSAAIVAAVSVALVITLGALSAEPSPLATSGGRLLIRHAGNVFALGFAPSGRLLASGGADETIRVHEQHLGVLCQPGTRAMRRVNAPTPKPQHLVVGKRDAHAAASPHPWAWHTIGWELSAEG